MNLSDEEDEDYARLMRLLDEDIEGNEEHNTSDLKDPNQPALFQQLDEKFSSSTQGIDDTVDREICLATQGAACGDVYCQRLRAESSNPDGISLEWEDSERGSLEQPGH